MVVLLPPYKRLKNLTRYTLVRGGRGSAKSFHVSVYLLFKTFEKGETWLYTRYTMTSATISIIPEFKEKIYLYGMGDVFDISGTIITNRLTGSKIIFSGIKTSSGNQTARLKSIQGLTGFVLDESEEMVNPKDFHTIDDSIRQKGGSNQVIIIFNSVDTDHWIYEDFYQAGERKDTTYIHTTYLDNAENLDESFLNKAERIKEEDPEFYKVNYLAAFSSLRDKIFTKGYNTFSEDPTEFDYHALGGDWGFADHPTACVEVWKNGRNLYLKEIIYEEGLTNEMIAGKLKKLGLHKTYGVWDSSEPKSITELRNKNVNANKATKNPGSVKVGIKILDSLSIFIHKDSRNLQREWKRYRWMKRANGEYARNANGDRMPQKIDDDAIDAVRYVVYKFASWK